MEYAEKLNISCWIKVRKLKTFNEHARNFFVLRQKHFNFIRFCGINSQIVLNLDKVCFKIHTHLFLYKNSAFAVSIKEREGK